MGMTDWREGLSLGFGYDEVRADAKQRAVGGLPTTQAEAGEEGEYGLLILQSAEEFDEALDINAHVEGGYGLFSGSAKFGFKSRCKVSSQATFCVLRLTMKTAYQYLADPVLEKDAWDLLEARNSIRFRQRFGDRFVSGLYAGIEFYGVVRIEAEHVERQKEIAADIQASYATFVSGGASVESTSTEDSSSQRIEISLYQKGGRIEPVRSIEELFALSRSALDDGRAGRGYPFAVMLDDYNELRLPNDSASFVQTEAAKRNLKKLAEDMWALQKMQNDIDFVLRNQNWFLDPPVEELNSISRQIGGELNAIVEQADVCSRDFTECKSYAPTYPVFALPQRRAGAPEAPSTPAPIVLEPSTAEQLRREALREGPLRRITP